MLRNAGVANRQGAINLREGLCLCCKIATWSYVEQIIELMVLYNM
jgi:hypothetical protein